MFSIIKKYAGGDVKKLLLPILVILLCFTFVVGATFALFTNGEDGNIGINTVSGYMDIDIVDTEQNSLVNETMQFVTLSDDPLYFEPGATIHTQGFVVKNNGSITVNYRIFVSEDTSENMAAFSDAFEIYVSPDRNDLSKAISLVDFSGTLAPGQVGDTYYIILKMKENANNDFQDNIYSGIGITVHAVQGNVDADEIVGD